jgi:tetratricopeptide (TPR) repeat protein
MDVEALFVQATNEIQAGRHDVAQGLLSQVLQADPRHEQAWLTLALVVPNMDQAIDCLNRVLALNPQNAEALNYLELAHEEQRRDRQAEMEASTPGPARGFDEDVPAAPASREKQPVGHLPRLGRYLLEARVVTVTQIEAALAVQRKAASAGKPKRLGEILVEQRIITLKELDAAVREQFQRFNSLFWD